MTIRQKAIQGYKWNIASTLVAVATQLLQVYFTAKYLSPADFGVWGIVVLILGFVMIFSDVGISGAIIHHQQLHQKHESSLYWLTVFVGFGLAAVVLLMAPLIMYFFQVKNIFFSLAVISLSIIVISFGKQFEIFLQKELQFRRLSVIDSLSSLVGFATVIACLNAGFKVEAMVYGFFAGSFAKSILLVFSGMKNHKPQLHFRLADVKAYINFGLFQIGEKNINYFSERFDQIIIGRFLGAGQLGLYNFSFNLISQPISRINPIINKVSLPVFATMQDRTQELKSVYFKTLRVLTYVNATVLLGLLAVSETLVLLVFGEKWQQSIHLLQLLSVVTLLRSVWNPLGSLLLALGKASWGFYWNIFLLAVTIPVILVSSFGGDIHYVGYSLIGIQLLLFLPAYFFLMKPLLGNCLPEFIHCLAKPLLISAAMCGVVMLFTAIIKRQFSITIETLLLQVLVGAFIQVLLVLLVDKKAVAEIVSFVQSSKGNQ